MDFLLAYVIFRAEGISAVVVKTELLHEIEHVDQVFPVDHWLEAEMIAHVTHNASGGHIGVLTEFAKQVFANHVALVIDKIAHRLHELQKGEEQQEAEKQTTHGVGAHVFFFVLGMVA